MLLVVGWDGASWNVLEPWLQQGRLPALARLRRLGLSGPLRAPWPPVTFPSWTTFMTGVNPGRHGIFDFTRREPGTYRVRFVNATYRQAPTVWKILSELGRRICVVGLPATYPPEPVNGILVSGFDTPVTTKTDDSFVYPPSAAPLIRDLGGFPFAEFQEFVVNREWYRMARRKLLQGIERKLRLAQVLLRRERWDCFFLLFGESDTASHHYWHFFDPQSPLYDPEGASEFGSVLLEVFERLDLALAALWREVPDADVLLLSDHGFGGASGWLFHANRWLAEQGWLRFLPARRVLDLTPVKRWALRWVPPRWQAPFFRWRQNAVANELETRSRFSGIDFKNTWVFSEESSTCPSLWVNLAGRDPAGRVAPRDYERVRDEVAEAILRLPAPGGETPAVARVWRREELYEGPCLELAPDLLIELAETTGGYSYSLASSGGVRGPLWSELDRARWQGGKLGGLSGTHRREGIFALAGPQVERTGEVITADMVQMAPTILSLCGTSVAQLFDGETLCSVVSTSRCVVPQEQFSQNVLHPYSALEEAELEQRLRNLGYLD